MSAAVPWDEMQALIGRNDKERELVAELRRLAVEAEGATEQLAMARTVAGQFQAVWQRLLACRRSELMACVPLASERVVQIDALRASLEAAARAALAGLDARRGLLAAFVSVNRATAEELSAAGVAPELAEGKRRLAALEEQLAAGLHQLAAESRLRLAASAAPAAAAASAAAAAGQPAAAGQAPAPPAQVAAGQGVRRGFTQGQLATLKEQIVHFKVVKKRLEGGAAGARAGWSEPDQAALALCKPPPLAGAGATGAGAPLAAACAALAAAGALTGAGAPRSALGGGGGCSDAGCWLPASQPSLCTQGD
ncbi:hypothetical protein HT031_005261 [Scenedesmus sp. PABB004]|nr:hypothetical protein HT031_005261 [Scenedesmus sp. PABB004]